jgi:hypothetical protein
MQYFVIHLQACSDCLAAGGIARKAGALFPVFEVISSEKQTMAGPVICITSGEANCFLQSAYASARIVP